ncbi:MAG: D-alanine--poly(phosphoribitol) ligase, partial [Acidimicrobiales bacterium]
MTVKRLECLVAEQAQRTPDQCAIVFGDRRVNFADLEVQANQISGLLTQIGCKQGDRVCLLMPKGIDAIAGMLGTLKVGAAYVPIDLESPATRVQRIVDSCEPRVILVAPEGEKLLSELLVLGNTDSTIVSTSRTKKSDGKITPATGFWELGKYSEQAPQNDFADTDPAHILFTSGSTGVPKGVVITHRNVASFLEWATDYFSFEQGEQISGHPPLHFDLSTFDIYGALSRGLTLHLVSPKLNLLAPILAEWIRSSRLTQWFSVPSIMTYMAKFDVVRQND